MSRVRAIPQTLTTLSMRPTPFSMMRLMTKINIIASYDSVFVTESKTKPLNSGAITMIAVCSIFLALALLGSAMDVYGSQATTASSTNSDLMQHSETTPILQDHNNTSEDVFRHLPLSVKKLVEFVKAFSLFRNVRAILSTKQVPTTTMH